MPMSDVADAASSRQKSGSFAMKLPVVSYTCTSHCSVQKSRLRPSGDHCTCASCVLSSLPHSLFPSTEPTMTAPSS